MRFFRKKPSSRLSQIKATIGLIIILILISIGFLIYQNHTNNTTDAEHKQAVDNLSQSLERFYTKDGSGFYPPLANLQNSQWLSANLSKNNANIKFGQNQNETGYIYVNRDVSDACQNPDPVDSLTAGCADFKLTARLSNGEQYIKLSRNGL